MHTRRLLLNSAKLLPGTLNPMSNAAKKTRTFRQPHKPPTPEANVWVIVLGYDLAGRRPLAEFVKL